jgi:hypothetical protein
MKMSSERFPEAESIITSNNTAPVFAAFSLPTRRKKYIKKRATHKNGTSFVWRQLTRQEPLLQLPCHPSKLSLLRREEF